MCYLSAIALSFLMQLSKTDFFKSLVPARLTFSKYLIEMLQIGIMVETS